MFVMWLIYCYWSINIINMNANGGDQDDDMTFVVCDSDTIIINGRDLLTSNGSSNYILDLELGIQ
ncbi:hypothetical protein DERF_011047 [Dermatophagoides farinae]|uniref:Uncharacterized protein n=1 Tax=Dermatophagoides farinae TaxID=6954 RepID=A0A922HU66_DERFA|nr:hypothetical protein HUG17_5842 [Dermatophagoides farinae]KAH9506307.1 hypothetical protein DERF_011047 [Dermatophagoides farinae]